MEKTALSAELQNCCGSLSSDLGVGCGAARPMVIGIMQMIRQHRLSGERAHIKWFRVGGKAEKLEPPE